MARKLTVEIIGDSSSLERAFGRSSKAANRFGTTLDQNFGGARISRVESGFQRLQGGLAGAFVGGAIASGAIAGIKRLIDVSAESQQVLGQTKVALEATGHSWDQYSQQIESTIAAQQRLGFDDEAL